LFVKKQEGNTQLTQDLIILIVSLVVIVIAAEIFTNAIESLGAKLKFSEGVTGSIFAAVGTALPETMVPLVAIFAGNSEEISHEVGVGAILGAPFMLATLAMFLVGGAAWIFRHRRKKVMIHPEHSGLKRDLEFFLFVFSMVFCAKANIYFLHSSGNSVHLSFDRFGTKGYLGEKKMGKRCGCGIPFGFSYCIFLHSVFINLRCRLLFIT